METTEHTALPETFAPEPGELFVEETPKPFAISLREILEEYRSDSTPSRYAMAVELGEADDWELYQGPQPRGEPLYPVNGAAMQSLLHDSWSDRETPRRQAGEEWNWMDIVSEFQNGSAPPRAEAPTQREQPPMTYREEQDSPRAYTALEDILAEFGSDSARTDVSAPLRPESAPVEPVSAPIEPKPKRAEPPRRMLGRRAALEAEALSLLGDMDKNERPAGRPEPAPPAKDEAPPEAAAPEDTEPAPPAAEEEAPETEAAEAPRPEKRAWPDLLRERFRRPRRRKAGAEEEGGELLEELHDADASPAAYAARDEYEGEEPPAESFPSFGEYLLGLLSGVLVRLRGFRGPAAGRAAVDVEEEELGEERPFRFSSRYYAAHTDPLRLRCRLALGLWAVMAYLTLGVPATGLLRSIGVASQMILALQLGVMLLALDVAVGAAVNLRRLRFGADGLALFGCLLTSLDALGVASGLFGEAHVPLCLFSSLSLIGVLYASYFAADGLHTTLGVPEEGRVRGLSLHSITAETGLTEKNAALIQSLRPPVGFVRRSEEAPLDEMIYNRAAPMLLALAFLLSLALTALKRDGSSFLFVFSALLVPAVPVTALLCFALPFKLGALNIALGPKEKKPEDEKEKEEGAEKQKTAGKPGRRPCAAAIAGWSGLAEIGGCRNLIVTDQDLFPGDAVRLLDPLIFTDVDAGQVISYAGTMMAASGCGLAPCFAALMERNGFAMKQLEEFEFHVGSGMLGQIEGHSVCCGTGEFMELMKISIPVEALENRNIRKTAVMLAVDRMLYGIFPVQYTADPHVREALIRLMRSNRHAVFATRDFNISPALLAEVFKLNTSGYDFPPYRERVRLSEGRPDEGSKISALTCGEGLGKLVHMADVGRRMYFIVWVNLIVSLLSSAVGPVAVFLLLYLNGTVSVAALFLYALVWLLPVALVSLLAGL